MDFFHVPIMLNETIDNLITDENGIYVDGTIGGAGHSREIVKRLGPKGRLIGIDRDKNALKAAEEKLEGYGDKITLAHSNFSGIKRVLDEKGIDRVDGVLLDIGVSSPQLDTAERGFSYMQDAPLDMRMDTDSPITAADIVNNSTEEELRSIIQDYGEEKWAARIAKFIVDEREKHPLRTTGELVEVIKRAIPASARREGPHPAKRTFQAIRISVNKELDEIENAIPEIVDVLNPGGRICVITFHSLEDRIVKNAFKNLADPCTCPPNIPVCVCNKKPKVTIVTRKPIVPGGCEIENNPRARSAKLRVAERL